MADQFDQTNEDLEMEEDPFLSAQRIEGVLPNEEMQEEIAEWLISEFDDVYEGSDTQEARDHWETWRRQRLARPESKTKNTPWPGAANVAVPAVASNTNNMYAYLKAAFSRRRPLWTVESDDAAWRENAAAVTRWLDRLAESKRHLNIRQKNNLILYDLGSMGTQFVDIPWKMDRWQFKRLDEDGNPIQVSKVIYDGPSIEPLRIEDLVTRPYWTDIQKAPWVGIIHLMTWPELSQNQSNFFFENVEKIEEFFLSEYEESREVEASQLGLEMNLSDKSRLYEIIKFYAFYDVDNDGIQEDLIIWVERQTRTIIRAEYNELGRRPIPRGAYLQIPHQLYAVGIGWMGEYLQEEIDTLHNMRINATHLNSLQMIATKRGAGLGPKEKFFPLKQIELDNPQQDIKVLTFPDVSQSTFMGESMAKRYLEEFTGLPPAMTGQPDPVAKSGTSGMLQQFQATQGSKLADALMENAVDFESEIGMIVLLQLVANSDRVLAEGGLIEYAAEEDQDLISEVLQLEVEDIPLTFKIEVHVTEIDETEESRRQQILMLHKLYSVYSQEMLQMLQVMTSPEVPNEVKEFAAKVYSGRTALMEETLKLLNQEETDKLLPYTEHIELMLTAMEQMRDAQVGQARKSIQGGQGERGVNALQRPNGGFQPPGGGTIRSEGFSEEPGVGTSEETSSGGLG